MGVALWPLSKIWETAARVRVRLYRSGKLERRSLSRPVISIGNLSAGGTGKTPFVIWLFQELRRSGVHAAVLTRGYRRPRGDETLILSHPGVDAGSGGDEVQVMLRHGVAPVGVDADRFRAGRAMEAECHPDLFLLDDGFQHLSLSRDLDVVLVDSTRPPWQDRMLPAGRLREPLSALSRAHFVVVTRVQAWTEMEYALARLKLAAPRAGIVVARTRLSAPPGETAIAPGLAFAFAGIGNPKAFFADLCLAGVQVVGTRAFRDHHNYTVADLRSLQRRAEAAGAFQLVTTEKDAVKIGPALREESGMPIRVAVMTLDVEGGEKVVGSIVSLLKQARHED